MGWARLDQCLRSPAQVRGGEKLRRLSGRPWKLFITKTRGKARLQNLTGSEVGTRLQGRHHLQALPEPLHRSFPLVRFYVEREQARKGHLLAPLADAGGTQNSRTARPVRRRPTSISNARKADIAEPAENTCGSQTSREQRIHEIFGIERQQISNLFAHAHISHRNAHLTRDRDHNAAFGSAI